MHDISVRTSLVIAFAASIVVAVQVSTRRPTTTGETVSRGAQDPAWPQASMPELVDALAALATRARATAELARRGRPAADAMVAGLARLDPGDDLLRPYLGVLRALGSEASAAVPHLGRMLGPWSVGDSAAIVDTMAELAPWVAEPIAVPAFEHTFNEVHLAGVPLPRGFTLTERDALWRAANRLSGRARARSDMSVRTLASMLTDSKPDARLAALDVLTWRGPVAVNVAADLARCIRAEHPPCQVLEWVDQQTCSIENVPTTASIRDRAAATLLSVAPGHPHAAIAWAHYLVAAPTAAQRARAATELGPALANPARLPKAAVHDIIEALVDAAGAEDLVLAREAVTALGLAGSAAHAAVPVLREPRDSPDRNLAARAAAALAVIER